MDPGVRRDGMLQESEMQTLPEQDTRNDRRYRAMDTIAMSQTIFVTFGNLKLRKMWLCYGAAVGNSRG